MKVFNNNLSLRKTCRCPLIRLFGGLIAIFLMLSGSGCATRLLEQPTDAVRYFVLDTGRDQPSEARWPHHLELVRLNFPRYLEGDRLIMRQGDHEILITPFQRWAENLQPNATRALGASLHYHLAPERFSFSGEASGGRADFYLSVRFEHFEGHQNGNVLVSGVWSLSGGEDRNLILKKPFAMNGLNYQSENPATLAKALSQALDRLAAQMATTLRASSIT
jgi:uncharacterized lipoprotein YmbA